MLANFIPQDSITFSKFHSRWIFFNAIEKSKEIHFYYTRITVLSLVAVICGKHLHSRYNRV